MFSTFVLLVAGAATPGIGVMDFAAEGGASADLASALSTVVTQELERLDVFRVTSSQTTRVMLGVERQRQMLGCENCSGEGLTDLANFDFILSGKVVKSSGQLRLFLSLIPVGSSKASSSTQVSAANDSKLLFEAGPAVVKLVGKMLAGKQGLAVVTSSEAGAAVKVDDTQVGTTPLPAPLKLAGGPHFVSVEKDGYTASRRDIRVTPDQVTEAHFTLAPSPDTITAYEARTGRTRTLAYVAGGLAVVGLGVFIAGELRADHLYGSATSPGSFLYHQAALTNGIETENGIDHRQLANELKGAVETWQIVSITSLAVGAAAAITSVVLFILGEPPDKYSAFHAGVMLSPGSAGFSLAGVF